MNYSNRLSRSDFAPSTFVELLQWRAHHRPDRKLFTFLEDGEKEEVHLTFGELDRKARAIAALLQSFVSPGERALLLYPPGLDYISAFFGCLYAGVVAVPAYPPDPSRLDRTLPRLEAILADVQVTVVLTTTPILSLAEFLFDQAPDLGTLQWMATDTVVNGMEYSWREHKLTPRNLAFLQYTSGSTRTPKGVMVSHANLMSNSAMIARAFSISARDRAALWLPPYHDMGLIGGILQPIYSGFYCILMSPISFLQKPLRWLQAISSYKATIAGGPNFGYDLSVRKSTPNQRAALDLSSWTMAFTGSEPVRPETLSRFAAAFEPCGFQRRAFYPCYGLAESTLFVTGGFRSEEPVLCPVQSNALKKNQVVLGEESGQSSQTLVGCGHTLAEHKIEIVHPDLLTRCPPEQLGEIWVSGPSVAQGYWNQLEETEFTFRAYLADTGEGPFLRTGDLGFQKDGELFVTGRLKDLIIIRGRNHYPQDIEYSAERSHPALRPGCGAAFTIDIEEEERLYIVHEVDPRYQLDFNDVVRSIRQSVAEAHDLQVYSVVLVEPRNVPKTSSGKIQRNACRASLLSGTLKIVKTDTIDDTKVSPSEPSQLKEALLIKALMALRPEDRQAILQSHLQEQIAKQLRIPMKDLDLQQPLRTWGIDSVTAVDLATVIETSLGINLGIEVLTLDTTVSQLSTRVLKEMRESNHLESVLPVQSEERLEESFQEFPLSYGQRALWFIQKLAPQSVGHNIVQPVKIPMQIDNAALKQAFNLLASRHPILRTTIASRIEPIQRVNPGIEFGFTEVDATSWSEAELNQRLSVEMFTPFDLEQGPLMRVTIFKKSAHENIMLLAMHHIITDMWSLTIMLFELPRLYMEVVTGIPAQLKPINNNFADYVRWQADLLAGPKGEQHWEYWREKLKEPLPELSLPIDRPRPPLQTDRGAAFNFHVDEKITERLKSIAKLCNTDLQTVLLAAFQVLLHRYTGQDDILVGSPRAGRNHRMARIIGFFINTLVLRVDLSKDPAFSTFLTQVHQTVREASEHDNYPFPLLVERLQPVRDLSRSPIFQVMFAWQKTTGLEERDRMASFALGQDGIGEDLGKIRLDPMSLRSRVTPFDLTLIMVENGGGVGAAFEYNIALFDESTIRRFADHLLNLLQGIVADPHLPVSRLPLISGEEEYQLLVEWNARTNSQSTTHCIHKLFEDRAAQTPQAIAIACAESRMTYAELEQQANQLAHALTKRGVCAEKLVGVCVERSPEAIVALLGILKAGGVYLPLDPAAPAERLAFMLEDAKVQTILTQTHLLPRLSLAGKAEAGARWNVICLDSDWPMIALESAEQLESLVGPENLAYVIYTSGSTGQPKGVLIDHKAIARHCLEAAQEFGLTPDDHVLQFAALTFDQSVEQILCTLISGAQLVLREAELWAPSIFHEKVLQHKLTVINLPPPYWHQVAEVWANDPQRAPSGLLRLVIIGGDVLQKESLNLWLHTPACSARLLNAYGPTETIVTATTFDFPPDLNQAGALERVPIGRPLGSRTAYLLDRYGNPVPVGVPGELHIGGPELARGYLNRPELTAEKFIPDPFLGSEIQGLDPYGLRLYKTGDLARYRRDGNIEFLGRVDAQVKIRGFRIELGEIEAILAGHPAVRQAAVSAGKEGGSDRRLVAYIVTRPGFSPAAGELSAYLSEKLPGYMIPQDFVFLDGLPLTSSGKVDRRALPAPNGGRPELASVYIAPRSPLEADLAKMWAELLGIEQVGVQDNFFGLGGHSLLATQVVARVREAYQVDVPLRKVFENPTVADLSTTITQCLAENEQTEELDQLLAELDDLSDEEVKQLLTGDRY